MSVAKLCESLGSGEVGELESWEEKLDIQVFTTTANGKNELEVEPNRSTIVDGVKVTYFKRSTKDHTHFSPGLLYNLFKVLRQAQHDKIAIIIHIHAWWNLVSVLSCAVAFWHKTPVVLSPRGMLTSYTQTNRNSFAKKFIHKLIGKRLLNYCHIHATSEQEKQDVLSIINPKSIGVIPNLVELEGADKLKLKDQSFKSFHELPDGKRLFKLIFLSRIEEKKGIILLFNALAMVDFDFTLSIAGSGDEAYIRILKTKARDLKIDHQITWLGQIKNDDKFALLKQHDCLVLCSYNENFANVVVESLSVGTPVILSDQVGLSDYVKENDLGWITNLNVNTIANCLKNGYENAAKRNKISKLAPSLISKDFNDKTLVHKYIKLYKDIANGRL